MKIFPRQVKEILDTLPIGYYAECRVPTALDEEGDSSYIDLIRREIVIGFKLIEQGVAKVEDETYLESAIRAMLYHEVSHAILTPRKMKVTDIINIFEDERIETILSDFYLNVDFKKNVKLINDWDSYCMTRPKDAMDAFYRAVRYRVGKQEWLDTVEKIIKDYHYLTSVDDWFYCYTRDIKDLYDLIARDFPSTPTSDMTEPPKGDGDGKEGKNSGNGMGNDMKNSDEKGNGSSMENGEGDEGDSANSGTDNGEGHVEKHSDGLSEKDIERMKEIAKKALQDVAKGYYDSTLEQTLGRIIDSFNRKTQSGSALQAYSGVINPRLVGRPDYRIFERQSTEKGTNKFGTVHLNLFLDESGSFWSNQDETNKLIATLTQIERTNKNFSLDIVYCGYGERLVENKKDRQMICGGGNRLDDEIFGLYRQLQKPNTFNYNIVLFDGDAFSDCGYGNRQSAYKNFGAFNHSNCTIISDPSNTKPIIQYAPSARKVITKNYLPELIKNVTNALQFAFH